GARPARPHGFVIGIKQPTELRPKRLVLSQAWLQDERLEEPGRVSQVPLHRTGFGHGLEDIILRQERFTQLARCTAHGLVTACKRLPLRSSPRCVLARCCRSASRYFDGHARFSTWWDWGSTRVSRAIRPMPPTPDSAR